MNLKCAADGCRFNELCDEANNAKEETTSLRAKLDLAVKALEKLYENKGGLNAVNYMIVKETLERIRLTERIE